MDVGQLGYVKFYPENSFTVYQVSWGKLLEYPIEWKTKITTKNGGIGLFI